MMAVLFAILFGLIGAYFLSTGQPVLGIAVIAVVYPISRWLTRPRIPNSLRLQEPGFNEDGVYVDKWGSKCVCGKCRPPQVINCDVLAKVAEAQKVLATNKTSMTGPR